MNKNAAIEGRPIGVIHCRLQTAAETPMNFSVSQESGTLEVFPQYREAMEGLKVGQTVVALFWLHEARRDLLKVYPRGDKSRGLHGVFSTRSPMRPNPIAISELKIVGIRDNLIEVAGVDVFDGTPLLDIKKKL